MAWFRKRVDATPIRSVQIPREHQHPGDWIMVPFRFAEAARVSIHTIGCQEEISDPVRYWIAQWLADYNYHLVAYMKEYYGPEILPLLDRITEEVKPPDSERQSEANGRSTAWDHWENQFKEDC
jgi:hypothetical protein